jgi:hypothetical protein
MSTQLLQQFPSLAAYPPSFLKDLLSSPELTEAFLFTLPEVQELASDVERLGKENEEMASELSSNSFTPITTRRRLTRPRAQSGAERRAVRATGCYGAVICPRRGAEGEMGRYRESSSESIPSAYPTFIDSRSIQY